MNAPYIVNTLKTDATKQEEIDFLNAIAAHVEARTYLSQLLTPALISWTTTQIKNDFSPDAFGFYQQEAAEHEGTKKVAIVFEDSRSIAVLDIAMLNQDIIEYPNRWRGDEFEADIRKAICPMVEEEA